MNTMPSYIHELYAHELGYRGGFRPGQRRGAGSYLYVPHTVAEEYFPPLRKNKLNDYVLLQLEFLDTGHSVLAQYVYHNDSLLKIGTRNEYRIYLSKAVLDDKRLLEPGNILVFQHMGTGMQEKYLCTVLTAAQDPDQYRKAKAKLRSGRHIVAEFPMSGKHAQASAAPVIPEEVLDSVLDEESEVTVDREEEESVVTRQVRDAAFREIVRGVYGSRCCVTDSSIDYKTITNLEACHIIPVRKRGSDHPSNGLLLARDPHWAFDRGFFTIGDDFKIVPHDAAGDQPFLKTYAGHQIRLPRDSRAHPHPKALKWHREHIFGAFRIG